MQPYFDGPFCSQVKVKSAEDIAKEIAIMNAKTEIDGIIKRIEHLKNDWDGAEREVTRCRFIKKQKQERNRITILRHEMQQLEAVMAELPPVYNTMGIQDKMNVINDKLEQINDDDMDIEHAEQEASIQYDIESIYFQILKIKSLTVVDDHRLEAIRESEPDMYKAVKWLQCNKLQFEKPVYLPLYLEIDVKKEKFTDIIEAKQDLLKTFVCLSPADYSLFVGGVINSQVMCRPSADTGSARPNYSELQYREKVEEYRRRFNKLVKEYQAAVKISLRLFGGREKRYAEAEAELVGLQKRAAG